MTDEKRLQKKQEMREIAELFYSSIVHLSSWERAIIVNRISQLLNGLAELQDRLGSIPPPPFIGDHKTAAANDDTKESEE